jgi:predicted dehydrogenase
MSTPNPLRLGIVGAAGIARQFTRDLIGSPSVRIDAIASRSAESAAAFAAAQGIARHHGSYEALLADPAIDAIYLPLPNSMHAEWAIRAAAHGKHVLCEKPLALDAAEARAMFEAARRHGVKLLESYPWWFQPQTRELVALLEGGVVGTVRLVQASFGFTLPNPQTNIRLKPELGGGVLLDAGSYTLSVIRLAMGCAPARVRADATWADSGVDLSAMATLFFADGRRAQLSCTMEAAGHRRATIAGTRGTIETEYLNHTSDLPRGDAYGYLPGQLRVRRGTTNNIPFDDIHAPTGSGFRFAAEAFAKMVAEDDGAAIRRYEAASIDIAATLAALRISARESREVAVEGAASQG